jgi:hypothetical protein
MGIDLIAENYGIFSAVQCKYKKPIAYKKTCITWKALSTFYALCLKSGPWDKYIVMTNSNFVRHVGKKTYKDLSICLATFSKISSDDWINMTNITGHTLQKDIITKPLSQEELKIKRLAYYDKHIII